MATVNFRKNHQYGDSLRIFLTLMLTVSAAPFALAAPADLDTSFSSDGYTGIYGTHILHPDGRILEFNVGSAASTGLVAYDSTGTSVGGTPNTVVITGDHRTQAAAVQSTGKIIVTGYVNASGDEDVFVVRFNSNLTLDTTFGNSGIVRIDAGGNGNTRAYGIGIQADDKILLATRANAGTSNDVVVRLSADGAKDNSFGTNGETAVNPIAASTPYIKFDMNSRSVAVSANGMIYAAGNGQNMASEYGMGVVRYNANGILDTSFGDNGFAFAIVNNKTDDEANAIALQPDGKIVLAGGIVNVLDTRDYGVVRFGTSGLLDVSFSGDGIFTHDAGQPTDAAYGVVIQPDGKIVFGGTGTDGLNETAVIARLSAAGILDTSFDSDGVYTNAVDGTYIVRAIQSDGKLLAATGVGAPARIVRFTGDAFDTQPDAIIFTDQIDVAFSTAIESNIVTVSGLSSGISVPVKVENGEYKINSGSYTSNPGYVTNGNQLQVRHTSSASNNTAVNTTLRFGGIGNPASPAVLFGATVSDMFTTTTLASGGSSDTTPDIFSFTDQSNVPLNNAVTSNSIIVAGINTSTSISITGGEYSINGAATTSIAGTVLVGDSVTLTVMSSGSNSATTSATLTIGGVSDSFDVTTLAATNNGGGGGGTIGPLYLLFYALLARLRQVRVRFII